MSRWSGMGLLEKVTFVQRLKGGEGVSLTETGGKRLPGTGNSQCKHSKLGVCVIECYMQRSRRPEWAGAE